mgnify:FL=1|tara:strand:- start:491 stop:763 length:273 start_codon:yes stop_codon:yes gene_type:complete
MNHEFTNYCALFTWDMEEEYRVFFDKLKGKYSFFEKLDDIHMRGIVMTLHAWLQPEVIDSSFDILNDFYDWAHETGIQKYHELIEWGKLE